MYNEHKYNTKQQNIEKSIEIPETVVSRDGSVLVVDTSVEVVTRIDDKI